MDSYYNRYSDISNRYIYNGDVGHWVIDDTRPIIFFYDGSHKRTYAVAKIYCNDSGNSWDIIDETKISLINCTTSPINTPDNTQWRDFYSMINKSR